MVMIQIINRSYKIISRMGCDQSQIKAKNLKHHFKESTSYYNIVKQNNETFVRTASQKLRFQVKSRDDFLQHHIDNELPISSETTGQKIRARQIIEHYIFKDAIKSKRSGRLAPDKLTEFALKAWFQRTFTQLLDKAEKAYFEEDRPYKEVKLQLAEGYVFEIYQMCSFINAGFGKYSTAEYHMQVPLSPILLNSDTALYFILEQLQQRYPLVASNEDNMTFPEVEELKSTLNLLTLIDSKCYADLDRYNYQSTMDDLKVLIDEANQLFGDFKIDMEAVLGPEVEVDCKVKWQKNEDGDTYYNASAVRRVFIKWSETLIERIPEVCTLKEFMDFVRSKKEMADQFIFKGTVTPTTHQQVLDKLSGLLQSIKCQAGTKTPRKQYGLFLYDLLRSKITRKTGQQVLQLLQTLKTMKITSTGKRFEVIRIKNRFKRQTRDLLVNFRYGEHLVAEVQLCIDTAHSSPKVLKQIKFRHMLYELQRGLFGPTFEMIMQYQDESRKDIVVRMQTEGAIKLREVGLQEVQVMKMAGRSCPQKHEMIAVKGDIFKEDRMQDFIQEESQRQGICDFCFSHFSINKEHHYCYYCSIFYCLKCINTYKATSRLKMKLSCLDHSLIQTIDTPQTLHHLSRQKKSIIAIFMKPNSLTSQLYLDQIVYLLQSFNSHGKPLPEIYQIDTSKKEFQEMVVKYSIERTPTTIIFDKESKRQVTMVGCTYSDIQSLIEIRERICNGLPKGLKIKCLQCDQIMVEDQKGSVKEKCQFCMDAFKIDNLTDFIHVIGGSTDNFICKQGHLRCNYCAYLSSNAPSYFRDYTGRSYLSTKLIKSTMKCSKWHPMDLIPTQLSNSYVCYKCKQIITDQTSEGEIGVCFKCVEYLCLNCHDNQKISFLQRKVNSLVHLIEIVSHFGQNKLEEGYPCGCGKYFWRVYQSQKINTNKHRVRQIFGFGVVIWTCFVCKKEQDKLQLHLACFYCKYAESLKGEPSHTQICLSCAVKSGLIGRKLEQKVKKVSTNLKCDSNHIILKSSEREKNSMSFKCISCKKDFHPYTERFICETCKVNICLSCGMETLKDMNPLTTSKVCFKNHHLVAIRKPPKLQFCTKCSKYLQGQHFGCTNQECKYLICLQCGVESTDI